LNLVALNWVGDNYRLDDRVDKLLDGSVSHLEHQTFLADAMGKMRTEVNTAGVCFFFVCSLFARVDGFGSQA
jgi:hypothetical protein